MLDADGFTDPMEILRFVAALPTVRHAHLRELDQISGRVRLRLGLGAMLTKHLLRDW